jgi:hypothetical protein
MTQYVSLKQAKMRSSFRVLASRQLCDVCGFAIHEFKQQTPLCRPGRAGAGANRWGCVSGNYRRLQHEQTTCPSVARAVFAPSENERIEDRLRIDGPA